MKIVGHVFDGVPRQELHQEALFIATVSPTSDRAYRIANTNTQRSCDQSNFTNNKAATRFVVEILLENTRDAE